MGERIRIATAQNSCCTVPAFFPFVEGICSQISEADAEIFKAVNFKNDGFVMRVAQAGDASGLYNVLRSYGTSQENYDDLEMFAEDKMDICVKNISCCLQHRFFVTFLLLKDSEPVAFFQIDPYRIDRIACNFQKKLSEDWGTFFSIPLLLEDLSKFSRKACVDFLQSNFLAHRFNEYFNADVNSEKWFEFIASSLDTYLFFSQKLPRNAWMCNISYNIIPKFQHCGLMSAMTMEIMNVLRGITPDGYLFSDRVAMRNTRSRHFLRKMGFEPCDQFLAFYGSQYKTRAHPGGNFYESCVGFYKKII